MRKDKEKATELRRLGKSYKEISRILDIPTATLCGWFKNLDWSIEIRNRLGANASFAYPEKLKLMVAATKKKYALLHEKYRQEAAREFGELKKNRLFLSGLMLYWGEGERNPKSSQVRLGNSDPLMIKTFYLFLKKAVHMPESKIGAWLLLYPDLIESVQKKFWCASTGLPANIFKKSIYIKGKHPTKRMAYGVCTLYVSSRALKERMLKWIELAADDLRNV